MNPRSDDEDHAPVVEEALPGRNETKGSLEDSTADSSPLRQGIPSGNGERILVVDDEKLNLELTKELLKHWSYVPLLAESGEEALEVLKREKGGVDLVILDLNMPGMGGYRCLQEMLLMEPDLKVIIASGYSSNQEVAESLDSGAAGFLAKPYHYHEMVEKIRQSLGAKRQI